MTKTMLYWIHNDTHTDPYLEGYIGVSCDPKSRLSYHTCKTTNDNYILRRAIESGAQMSILEEHSSFEKALASERHYRPSERIGWNIIPGGIAPPNQTGRRNPSVSESNKTRIVSDVTRAKMSETRIGTLWYNNGTVSVRRRVCPEGFLPGRLGVHTEESKQKIREFQTGRPKSSKCL